MESIKRLLDNFSNKEVIKLNIILEDLPKHTNRVVGCNIDVDMYEPVYSALKKIASLIVTGGIVIAEDQVYTPRLEGAHLALVDFLMTDMARKFVTIHMGLGSFFS